MTEAVLDEILDAFIKAGDNPSDDVLDAFAHATGKTKAIVEAHYRQRCIDQTGHDPYGPMTP